MNRLEDMSTPISIGLAVIAYTICSSPLLLANKIVLSYLPLPATVAFIEIVSASCFLLFFSFCGGNVDRLEWKKIKIYCIYSLVFVAAIYTNMQSLLHNNLETLIIFRSNSPILILIFDYLFMDATKQQPLTFRSISSLGLVFFASGLYCITDDQFSLSNHKSNISKATETNNNNGDFFVNYFWVILYLICLTFEMTVGVKITASVKMDTPWGPILYCNLLAIVPMFTIAYLTGEFDNLDEKLSEMPANAAMMLTFCCIAGTLIGYTGWLCRSMISMTLYNMLSLINKLITLFLNLTVWNKHASHVAEFAVFFCVIAGSFHSRVSTPKDSATTTQTISNPAETANPLTKKNSNINNKMKTPLPSSDVEQNIKSNKK
eukprot:gene13465-18061_t